MGGLGERKGLLGIYLASTLSFSILYGCHEVV